MDIVKPLKTIGFIRVSKGVVERVFGACKQERKNTHACVVVFLYKCGESQEILENPEKHPPKSTFLQDCFGSEKHAFCKLDVI